MTIIEGQETSQQQEQQDKSQKQQLISPKPELYFVVKPWAELTTQELYDFLKIRSDVFVVEQNCVYPDVDGKDHKAIHCMGYVNNPLNDNKPEMVAYTRIFKKGDYFDKNSCVGRVVVATKWRAYGYGHHLLDKGIEILIENFTMPITISAQLYLFKFYTAHGFKQVSEQYLEDDIPHIEMLLEEKDLTGSNVQFIGKCKYDGESQLYEKITVNTDVDTTTADIAIIAENQ